MSSAKKQLLCLGDLYQGIFSYPFCCKDYSVGHVGNLYLSTRQPLFSNGMSGSNVQNIALNITDVIVDIHLAHPSVCLRIKKHQKSLYGSFMTNQGFMISIFHHNRPFQSKPAEIQCMSYICLEQMMEA